MSHSARQGYQYILDPSLTVLKNGSSPYTTMVLYSLTCSSFISSFSLRTGKSRQSSNNASIRLTEKSNLSMFVTSGSISTGGADDGWFNRCENNLVNGV